jgi:hypothetical protein
VAEAKWLLALGPGDEHRCSVVRTLSGRRALVRFANGAELLVPRDLLRAVPKLAARPPEELLS